MVIGDPLRHFDKLRGFTMVNVELTKEPINQSINQSSRGII